MTCFQDLCNDIIIEILSYFNVHEIFYSYYLLIPYLSKLLINGRVRLHVRSNNSYFIRWILPQIELAQVYSLHVPTRPYHPSIFQFSGLRSLILYDVDNPLLLFESNNNWPPYSLEHLSLHIRNQDTPNQSSNIGKRVVEYAFQLRQLKYFELHESKSSLRTVELYDELNFPSRFHSSAIKCLMLTIYCDWATIQSMLSYLPDLHCFHYRSSLNRTQTHSSQLSFSSIRQLTLRLDGIQTDMFINIFRDAPLLRQCKLQCSFSVFKQSHLNLLKGDTWIQLFDTYTPRLKLLDIDLKFLLYNVDEKTIGMINEDLKILNFKLSLISYDENYSLRMAGLYHRV